MVPCRLLMSPSSAHCRAGESRHAPELSLVLLCRFPADAEATRRLLATAAALPAGVERIVVVEPAVAPERGWRDFVAWCRNHADVVVAPDDAAGLDALRLDEGILASRGRHVWLLDAGRPLSTIEPADVSAALAGRADGTVLVFVHPDDDAQLPPIPGVAVPWLDFLFKGRRFPLANVVFPRIVFDTLGLLDPHAAMARFYDHEFLCRVGRFFRLQRVTHLGAVAGVRKERFPGFFHRWLDVDRTERLKAGSLPDYEVEGLSPLRGSLPDATLWEAYLTEVLPYAQQWRHRLPDGLLLRPQSVPPRLRQVLCIKTNDYETLVDVGFRNFDWHAQGERSYKTSYVHFLEMDPMEPERSDALMLIRTVDDLTLSAAEERMRRGQPVGYALDDDLLQFHTYGGGLEVFRPGHPNYDAMVRTIERADVVLTSSPYIARSVERHNPRTAHYEGSVLPSFLPGPKAGRGRPFRFGYAGGGYRVAEMRLLWPALQRIAREYGDDVAFEFWGPAETDLPEPLPNSAFQPFSVGYYEYLGRLGQARFDAMLVPLLLDPAPRKAKAPNKLYESAVAGAVGIYSDVPSYEVVKRHDLGLCVREATESWYQAMRSILEMPEEAYLALQARALAFVREHYATPAMLPLHESGLEAIAFHGATREQRGADGRPRVLYVFPAISGQGGGEILFRRRIELARQAGILPVAVVQLQLVGSPFWEPFTEYLAALGIPWRTAFFRAFAATPSREDVLPFPDEEASVRALLQKERAALVHTGGYLPAFGKACTDLGIPHVMSNYIVEDDYVWSAGPLPYRHCDLVQSDSIRYARKWAALAGSPWLCARDVVPGEFFTAGFARLYGNAAADKRTDVPTLGLVGTLLPRKCQLEAIEALGRLAAAGFEARLDLTGSVQDDVEYVASCEEAARRLGVASRVRFRGLRRDMEAVYHETDVLLSVSTFESFPNTIKEANSAGVLVVATPAGGIAELLYDGANAILATDSRPEHIAAAVARALSLHPDESLRLRRNAYRMARQEFHPHRGMLDLLVAYNLALDSRAAAGRSEARREAQFGPAPPPELKAEAALEPPSDAERRTLGSGARWRVTPQGAGWRGLDLPWATGSAGEGGAVRLRVVASGGPLLREVTAQLEGAGHRGRLEFRFTPIANSSACNFDIVIEPDDAARARGLETWHLRPAAGLRGRLAVLRARRVPLYKLLCEER